MTIPLRRAELEQATKLTVLTLTPQIEHRNRLTCVFRPVLALPHLLLVGGPTAFGLSIALSALDGPDAQWGAGTGVLGLVAGVAALIAWFAILFTGEYPRGLWQLAAFYLRWRVRAMAYVALLRDEYPPFGDAEYPAHVDLFAPAGRRNRLTTAFRVFLLIPHFLVLWLVSLLWLVTAVVGWIAILFTGRFPRTVADYGVAALRWNVRVEAYLLLLHDEYPPFTLEA